MLPFDSFVDAMNFGTVRRYLTRPGSPITDVLFVENDRMLSQVAELLTDGQASPANRNLLLRWMRSGQIKVGGNAAPVSRRNGAGALVDVHAIPGDTCCRVLFLPPFYLVHLRRGPR